jgi:N-acetyl sugar amidotransferase
MPSTQEGQSFDESGICNVCNSNEDKMRIDWTSRRSALIKILEEAKEFHKNDPYDCLIPISGGKDSTYQLHVLVKEFGMRPLCVTFSHNWFSSVGIYNLFNALEKFSVDHVMFTPNRSLVNKLAKKSLKSIGDSCWHCHAGVGAYPLKVAQDYKIKLIIWGESIAEHSSRGTYANPLMKFDQDYFLKVSAKTKPEDMVDSEGGIQSKDLGAFTTPSAENYSESKILGIHLGDYLYWDEERQTEFVIEEYDWMETKVEGTYKGYKSAECIMPGVHDFTCYLKRGYGRATFHASADIRAGLLTRDEALEHLVPMDSIKPQALDYYLEITGYTEQEFYEIMSKNKNSSLELTEVKITENSSSTTRPKLFLEDLKEWLNIDRNK